MWCYALILARNMPITGDESIVNAKMNNMMHFTYVYAQTWLRDIIAFIVKKRWSLTLILSIIWIAFIFNEMAEDNKRIRVDAAAQLAYNSDHKIFQKRMSDSIQTWAIGACGVGVRSLMDVAKRGIKFDEKECVRQAVQYNRGPGYPSTIPLLSLIDEAGQGLNLRNNTRYKEIEAEYSEDNITNVLKGSVWPEANDAEFSDAELTRVMYNTTYNEVAPPSEKLISEYLPRALLPPISLVVMLWVASAYSRIRKSNFKNLFLLPKSRRVFRFGVATLLVYEFWLGFWVIFSDDWYGSHDWPQDWLILAIAIPVGLMMSYFAYQWAVAKTIKEASETPPELNQPITTQRAAPTLAPKIIITEEIQKEPDTSSPVSAPTISITHAALSPKKLSSNYFVRHWRGELPLSITYWVNGLLAVIAFRVTDVVLPQIIGNYSMRTLSFVSLGGMLFVVMTWFWYVVGIWRSADRPVAIGWPSVWANTAKLIVVVGFIVMGVKLPTNILPQVKEFALIASGNDSIGEIVIKVSENGQSVIVIGMLREGSAAEIQKILDAVPGATSLILQSNGGRLLEAQQLARAVQNRNLDTHVENQCLSACTFVFLAGKDRVATLNARIGFHQPSFPGLNADEQRLVTHDMMDVYRAAGLPESFVQRISETSPKDMWYPTREELIANHVITEDR